jgi:hypothetical protein
LEVIDYKAQLKLFSKTHKTKKIKTMRENGGNGHEGKVVKQVITLSEEELMEAIIHYVLRKYGNGAVSNIALQRDEEGVVTAECTLEPPR